MLSKNLFALLTLALASAVMANPIEKRNNCPGSHPSPKCCNPLVIGSVNLNCVGSKLILMESFLYICAALTVICSWNRQLLRSKCLLHGHPYLYRSSLSFRL